MTSKRSERGELSFTAWLLITSLIIIAVLFTFAYTAEYIGCNESTKSSQMRHYYNFFSGCMVEVEHEKWIPLDNYYYEEE